MVEIKFWAIGRGVKPWKRNIPTSYGNPYQYDASFTVTFDQNKVTDVEVNQMIHQQQQLFKKYHPSAKIVKSIQRQF